MSVREYLSKYYILSIILYATALLVNSEINSNFIEYIINAEYIGYTDYRTGIHRSLLMTSLMPGF